MKRLLTALVPLALLLAVVGCSTNDSVTGPTESNDLSQYTPQPAARLGVAGDLVSATLHMYVDIEGGQRVDVHRVTADWEECTVTHNSFGGAYDGLIYGSFMADGMGWRMVDVSGLVAGWMAEDFANFGLLLNQDVEDWPRSLYYSREGAYPPFLEVVHMDDGMMVYDTLYPTADVYIYPFDPDSNFCDKDQLWTGAHSETDMEKQSLIRFDLPTTPPPDDCGGCTLTIGYWKNHAKGRRDMVSQYLPITLGDPGGPRSITIRKAKRVVTLLRQKDNSNGILKLLKQLLAAKLNIAAGACDDDVADVVDAADEFLADHGRLAWYGLSKAERQMVLDWKDALDDYNNGRIGPGHCDGNDDGGGCKGGDDDDDDDDDGGDDD